MKCPICKTKLRATKKGNVVEFECPKCGWKKKIDLLSVLNEK